MKKKGFLVTVKNIYHLLCGVAKQHEASILAMGVVYSGEVDVEPIDQEKWTITISIRPFGDVFNVVKLTYADNRIMNRESWLAGYSYFGGGYLAELGGNRYCFFNHAHKALYLEEYDVAYSLSTLYQQNPEA